MTKSVLPQDSSKSNRVDPPHDLLAVAADVSTDDLVNPWMAYAGRDPEFTSEQVDRQAGELLSYVQDQNKEIDERQAELNAKLAQLDSQLRNARLRAVDDLGTDLLAGPDLLQAPNPPSAPDNAEVESLPPASSRTKSTAHADRDAAATPTQRDIAQASLALGDLGYAQEEVSERVSRYTRTENAPTTNQEFEEVDRIVAQFSDFQPDESTHIEDLWNHDPVDDLDLDLPVGKATSRVNGTRNVTEIPAGAQVSAQTKADAQAVAHGNTTETFTPSPTASADHAATAGTQDRIDAFPSMLAGSHFGRVDRFPQDDDDTLASERRLLDEQKRELERQKSIVGQLQQEAQSLHREALEMRIVTEQLWGQLSESTPPEKLKALLASLRSRLESHYAKEHETLANRKDEMQTLQYTIEGKQAALRDQSARMQEWFATREEHLRSYANEIDARCSLLDRREQRLQDEFAKWEAQRKDYELQLHGLAQKLKLNGISL